MMNTLNGKENTQRYPLGVFRGWAVEIALLFEIICCKISLKLLTWRNFMIGNSAEMNHNKEIWGNFRGMASSTDINKSLFFKTKTTNNPSILW